MAAIFILSGQSAEQSSKLSRGVLSQVPESVQETIDEKAAESSGGEKKAASHSLIRKTAHFFIYTVLGMIAFILCGEYKVKHGFITVLCLCCLYAVSDEFHQLFVKGRSCELRDVCIDTTGAFVGEMLAAGALKLKKTVSRIK